MNKTQPEELSEETKPWWKSKGVMGSLAVIIVSVFNMFDLNIDESTVTEILMQLSTVIAGATALYGRLVARYRIWKGGE